MGRLEQPLARSVRPGEGAPLVAEELAFEKRLGKCGAIHGHERMEGTGAALPAHRRQLSGHTSLFKETAVSRPPPLLPILRHQTTGEQYARGKLSH